MFTPPQWGVLPKKLLTYSIFDIPGLKNLATIFLNRFYADLNLAFLYILVKIRFFLGKIYGEEQKIVPDDCQYIYGLCTMNIQRTHRNTETHTNWLLLLFVINPNELYSTFHLFHLIIYIIPNPDLQKDQSAVWLPQQHLLRVRYQLCKLPYTDINHWFMNYR